VYTCKFIDDQLCGNYDSHEKHLSIKSWNVNGLAQKLRDPDFSNLIHNYGIVYLTKKWITSNSCVYLELPDFDCVHLYRNKTYPVNRGRSSGGLSIYSKNTFMQVY